MNLTLLCLAGCILTTLVAVPPYRRPLPMTLDEIPVELIWEIRPGRFHRVTADGRPGAVITSVPFADRSHFAGYVAVTLRAFCNQLGRALRNQDCP